MEKLSIKAEPREVTGKQNKNIRNQGKIPVVLYGHKVDNQNLIVDRSAFHKVYADAGASTLIDLIVDAEEPLNVLIHDVQFDPVTEEVVHADLYKVNMNEEVVAEVPIVLTGEAPAVKALGGILETILTEVSIKCLPGDLIHEIKVDVSGLKELNDSIRVKDLPVPGTVKIQADPEDSVTIVTEPKVEKVEAPVVAVGEEGEVAEGEAAEGEKKDETGEGETKSEAKDKGEGGKNE
ncbi:MAG: 50S ribosomal protein L25 [Candidatus Buchananbacteria bacterium CG10_big_fil_rev_8_21_14_0_10_42_9]|uniref:Large ribosomal subunit protein bL25 n=1 Tax=Candidatus Buchananbacteria bacterium CG10_big_fil_rev_8_21_14_0_10_42_9 TaxID=1974526 RepID=A0A2H0W4M2_9BACT|nr:MAG: 50S ribosomal protein L25 [Candidatus Buchananbacteria bacterium CG10_big_fil_rev_8_21_14_0_10_42_9]